MFIRVGNQQGRVIVVFRHSYKAFSSPSFRLLCMVVNMGGCGMARTPYRGALRTHQLLSQVPMTHSYNTKYDISLSLASKSGVRGGRDLCRGCWYAPWKNLEC